MQPLPKSRRDTPFDKLTKRMGWNLHDAIKKNKPTKFENATNYPFSDLKEHLELQFYDDMTWENYGIYWVIDHRFPVSFFIYESYDDYEFKLCWCLDNLQPLKKIENQKKSDTYQAISIEDLIMLYKKRQQ